MRLALVLGALLLFATSGVAEAVEAQATEETAEPRQPSAATRPATCVPGSRCAESVVPPFTPHYAIPEHELTVAESPGVVGAGMRTGVSEELEPEPEWQWARRHLADSRRFIDSYFAAELYPEISVSTSLAAAQVSGDGPIEFGSLVNLSLYLLDLRVPMVSRIDGRHTASQRVEMDLKIPFAWPGSPANRFAVVYGASIAPSGPALSDSSRFEVMYGYGGPIAIQARVGYGYRALSLGADPQLGLLYGAIVGVDLGKLQPSVELDAIRTTGTRSDRITLVPGLRLYPASERTLQLGLGAMLVFTDGELITDNRYGAVFEIGYNFL